MRTKLNKKQITNHKKVVVIIIAVIAIGGALTGAILLRKHYSQNNSKNDPAATNGQETINYAPATPQEKKDAEAHKDSLVKDTQNQSSQQTTGKTVQPVITSANPQNVSAYVPGVFEDGGTCTATFKSGGQSLTKASTGFKNVSNTQCAPIDLDSGFLSQGTWTVTVSYSSSTASGSSAGQIVRIP